jgi:L-cystine uptake protein TcyP (sodium:dicarboxylate symporter family)
MARTALNVHGSITAGVITGRFVDVPADDVAEAGPAPAPAD